MTGAVLPVAGVGKRVKDCGVDDPSVVNAITASSEFLLSPVISHAKPIRGPTLFLSCGKLLVRGSLDGRNGFGSRSYRNVRRD